MAENNSASPANSPADQRVEPPSLFRPSPLSNKSSLQAKNNQQENSPGVGRNFFLRPSPLEQQAALLKEPAPMNTQKQSTFVLEPAKLLNPFSNTIKSLTKEDEKEIKGNGNESINLFEKCNGHSKSEASTITSVSTTTTTQTTVSSSTTVSTTITSSVVAKATSSACNSFVFGSNLADRVVNAPAEPTHSSQGTIQEETKTTSSTTSSVSGVATTTTSSMSLQESAAQQQAKSQKPELKEVEVITGEEDESNVFQFYAKLHVFDKSNQSWREKGKGLLRLNDMPQNGPHSFQSRLVMRAQGSLRVMLNMKLWAGMLVERASHKSVKISAIDPAEGLLIYLITVLSSEAEQMFAAIESRAQQLKVMEFKKEEPSDAKNLPSKRTNNENDPNSISHPSTNKKSRLDPTGEESNDSTPYPETETSNEGFPSSSPAIQSSSPSSEA